ncbi:hypothetical protein [Desulfobacula sp.]
MGTITSFIQTWDGEKVTLEQKDIVEALKAQNDYFFYKQKGEL